MAGAGVRQAGGEARAQHVQSAALVQAAQRRDVLATLQLRRVGLGKDFTSMKEDGLFSKGLVDSR